MQASAATVENSALLRAAFPHAGKCAAAGNGSLASLPRIPARAASSAWSRTAHLVAAGMAQILIRAARPGVVHELSGAELCGSAAVRCAAVRGMWRRAVARDEQAPRSGLHRAAPCVCAW